MTRWMSVGLCACAMGWLALTMSGQEQPARPSAVTNNALPAPINPTAAKRVEVPLNGHVFSLPEGFTIELVAGPPLVDRPITASFDEDGRLYVSDSSGTNDPSAKQLIDKPHRVVRLEDTDGDGTFDKSLVFADKLMFPEGTLWHDGSLYVAAPPSIWKLTDTDGDGVADQRDEWFKGNTLTGCANDLHGPYLGPDGYLYWCKGAFAEQTYERPVRREATERQGASPRSDTTPNNSSDRGLAPNRSQVETKPWTTKASHIFRARPDAPRDPATGSIQTSAIECVMTGGMDNPVDVVFTPTGERIFTTTFLVHPGQGNRDGLLHAVYGGVYGKDQAVIDSPSHPRTGDVMPVLCHLGAAAPCGLERLQSAAWGREYQDNLFACCFNMRKVTRHVLTPKGATFDCATTDFVVSNNLDFHPTDVLEDADGSLLIVDTGGWYKLCCPTSQLWKPDVLGAIYRVRKVGESVTQTGDSRSPWQFSRAQDWKSLSMRREDNIFAATLKVSALMKHIQSDDGYLRERAIRTLAQHGDVAVQFLLPALENPTLKSLSESLSLTWALGRIQTPSACAAMRQLQKHRWPHIRAVAIYHLGLWRDDKSIEALISQLTETSAAEGRDPSSPVAPRQEQPSARSTPNEQSATKARSAIVSRSETATLKRLAAEALGRIGDKQAIAPLLSEAGNVGSDRFLEHSIIYALIEIGNPDATRRAELAASNAAMVKAALITLDQMPNGGLKPEEVAKHLTSPEPLLRETAAWIISRHPDWGEALAGDLRERLAAGVLTDAEQTTLGKQLAQFAKAASVQELLAVTVRDTKLPAAARFIALGAMRDSKLKELPKSWSAALLAVVGENDTTLIELALKTVRAIPPHKDDAAAWRVPLLSLASRGRQPSDKSASDPDPSGGLRTRLAEASMKLDALAALPGGLAAKETDDKVFDFLLIQLVPELPVAQRGTAAEVISKAKLTPAQLTKLTEQFATAGPLEVDRLLGAFEQSTDEQVGRKLIAALKAAPALTALRADAIRTRIAKYSPAVQDAAAPLYAALNVDLAGQKQRLEEMLASLPPGDIVRGQQVFHSEKAACKACHSLGYLGGKTGPDMTRIGGIRTERDLLESILFPSASFVRSFEPVLIVTTAGKTINGLIRGETADELVLATGPNQEARVARADIEEMRPSSVSIMPAGLEKQLTPQQLADLIAFLKNCK